jgi:hypothetical protein
MGVLATSLAFACATGPKRSSPSVARVAEDVTLLDGSPFPPSRKLGEVETTDCSTTLGQAPEIARAREALKRQAVRYGGNLVGNIMCDIELGPAHSDCWEVARCTGDVSCASASSNPKVRRRCM